MLSIIYNSVSSLKTNPIYFDFNSIFSCDANNFQISRSQRRVIQNMNLFINENVKPGTSTNSIPSNSNKNLCDLNNWIKTEPTTRAIQLIRHMLTSDTRINIDYLFSIIICVL